MLVLAACDAGAPMLAVGDTEDPYAESSEVGDSGVPDVGAAKDCTCYARCVEHNAKGEKIAFYNVDYTWTLAENEACEARQLIRDYLYYECMNSVIHPDYAEFDTDPKFDCIAGK